MMNQHARMIASAIAMAAGAIYSTGPGRNAGTAGGAVFLFAIILFLIDWFGSHKGEKP